MEENANIPELIETQIKMPIKQSVSIINGNPIGFLEKIGKYEFIYDYQVPNPFFNMYLKPSNTGIINDGASKNSSGFFNFDSDGTGGIKNIKPAEPLKPYVAYTVNPNPQVGTFSKGNIVNVLRFDGNNAIIQNPNFVEPDPTAVKTFWSGLMVDFKNQKEFSIPKDYLRKVDDTLAVTLSTGILYGANMIPLPPVKPIGTSLGEILEFNTSYIISKPFQFIKSYTNVRPLYELGGAGRLQYEQTANYDILPIGFEVTGNLMRQKRITGKSIYGMPETSIYYDVLVVSGMGQTGQLEIPIEFLTKKVTTSTPTNNGVVVPVEDNNKNLLMIIGAFLLGYVVFGKDKPTT
jgi:hypothetical protein